MKNNNKNPKILNILKFALLTAIVIIIAVFFINKKESLDLDELYTYGLANSSFQLQVEDHREYSGEEILLQYAAVKDGEGFNIKNVVFNQSMDTHPPLYYLLVNFVSSIHKNHFSIWHGLIVNVLFLIILFFEMRQLFIYVIDDKLSSTLFSITALLSYGFINCFVFTRMYVMLSAVSMAYIILLQNKIKESKNDSYTEKSDIKFLILLFSNCFVGMMTQYHFILIAGFFSIYFLIFSLYNKNYKLLIKTIIAGLTSIALSILIYPAMLKHMFAESGSLHSVTNEQNKELSVKFYEMAKTIKRAFFGDSIYVYFGILILIIILYFVFTSIKNKKNTTTEVSKFNIKNIITEHQLYFIFLLCFIYYYLIICITTKLTFARYFYNIYPIIAICIICPIYFILKNINNKLKYISIIIFIATCLLSRFKEEPFSLNMGTKQYLDFIEQNHDVKTIILYRDIDKDGVMNSAKTSAWKLPDIIYNFKSLDNISFVNMSNVDLINNDNENIRGFDDIFVIIFTKEDDDVILDIIKNKNNVRRVNKIFFNNYYHMYRMN